MSAPRIKVADEPVLGLHLAEIAQRMASDPTPSSPRGRTASLASDAVPLTLQGAASGLRTYLPEATGSGYWDILEVCDGMFLVIADAWYHAEQRIRLPPERLLKVRVVCSGAISIPGRSHAEPEGSAHAQIMDGRSGAYYLIAAGQRLQMAGLHVRPSALRALGVSDENLPRPMRELMDGAEPEIPFLSLEPVGRALRNAREILDSRDALPAGLRVTFLRAKAQELFCEVMLQVQRGGRSEEHVQMPTQRSISRLREAERIIASHLDAQLTIATLARLVGINRSELTRGFKVLYGCTIHSYQTRLRMEEGLRLLQHSDLSIAQVGSRVGYAHPSHFSKAVRAHFGLSPRELKAGAPETNTASRRTEK